ncbi:MAG: AIM24 family protein [Planctomycetia bacterium]|nr:AIM24 family protein [Planctomycetia bacterium]
MKVSDSGWTAAPRLRDLTEIHFGNSVCQIDGQIVPVAEVNLGAGDTVFFEHHTLLWKQPQTQLSVLSLKGATKRLLAGMPVIVTVAHGPGRVAFSRDNSGELVVLPMHPGQELDVREHAFLLGSQHIDYSYTRIKGLTNILFGGQGMFMDRFVTGQTTGLLLLHGYGNVFQRTLAAGESMLVEPGGFLYKDSSVQFQTEMQQLTTGFFGGTGMSLMRLTGPGRVGIQSMYHHQASE